MFGLTCDEATLKSLLNVSDVNECQLEAAPCPPRQACRNTFGSFSCVCRDGYVMGTLHHVIQCRGEVSSFTAPQT